MMRTTERRHRPQLDDLGIGAVGDVDLDRYAGRRFCWRPEGRVAMRSSAPWIVLKARAAVFRQPVVIVVAKSVRT